MTLHKATKPALKKLLAQGITDSAVMAGRLGVDPYTVRRALHKYGLAEKAERAEATPDMVDWIVKCASEGMPSVWIAEGLPISYFKVCEIVLDFIETDERNREWKSTFASMSRHPSLMSLHRSIAPRTAAEELISA